MVERDIDSAAEPPTIVSCERSPIKGINATGIQVRHQLRWLEPDESPKMKVWNLALGYPVPDRSH
jgi:hypothetical protein